MSSFVNKYFMAVLVLFGCVIAMALASGTTTASTNGLIFESFPLDKSVRCTTNRDCQGGEVCISGRCAILAGQLPSPSSGTGASASVSAGGASASIGISGASTVVIFNGLIGLMALAPLVLRM